MKWPEDFIDQIICDDCLEVMKGIPDNCVDTIITDPPYGIGFMGKEWDNFKSNFIDNQQKKSNEDYLKNIKRKQQYQNLKGRKLSPIGTRSSISGSYDLSPKGLMGFQKWVESWATEALRVAKPGATLLCFGGTRTYHRLACAIEDAGWILKDCIMWIYGSGFPKATDISKQIDKMAGKKRETTGYQEPFGREGRSYQCEHGSKRHRETIEGIEKKKIGLQKIEVPATPEATLWNGWKSHGLKPAYEPILVAMKPNEGSYANNALKYGVAGLNIDEGRIAAKQDYFDTERFNDRKTLGGYGSESIHKPFKPAKGRYPANVILDEEAGKILDEQSGVNCGAFAPVKRKKRPNNVYGEYETFGDDGKTFRGDIGGASRFFYCAKASKAERNRGCKGLEEKPAHDYGSIKKSEGRHGKNMPNSNYHPTVKPLSLMKYLCTLTKTPTGGIVLDPFCGSGTTLMACKELKRSYIGIDNIPEYCEIARRRVNAIPKPLF